MLSQSLFYFPGTLAKTTSEDDTPGYQLLGGRMAYQVVPEPGNPLVLEQLEQAVTTASQHVVFGYLAQMASSSGFFIAATTVQCVQSPAYTTAS